MMNKRSIFYTPTMAITPEELSGMTKFPSFYEPFARLTKHDTDDRELRNKTVGKLEYDDIAKEEFEVTEKLDKIMEAFRL